MAEQQTKAEQTTAEKQRDTVKKLKQRAEAAWLKRKASDVRMREVYDYVMPYRDVAGLQSVSGAAEGDSRLDLVFDSTAVVAAFRFPGRMQRQLTPIFNDFFALTVGPLAKAVMKEAEVKADIEQMQVVSDQVHAMLQGGLFHSASHEFYSDLYGGTAHMQILAGDARRPIICRCIPYAKVAIEDGPYGEVEHWYYKDSWRIDELPVLWPKAKLSAKVKLMIETSPERVVEVCQYTYLDREADAYKTVVWCDVQDAPEIPFWTESSRTSPWITGRFWKLPDEPYGRGPANVAMPTVKTLNMAQELALKAAAIALMGIWIYRNDRFFNPDTVRFEPRAMWAVGSTGGPLGRTIERLPTPQDFDISTIVINDQRDQAKRALLDDRLPAVKDSVRSPTEILERVAQDNEDLGGILGRATIEIIVPVVRRVIDLLETQGKLKTNIKVDQILAVLQVIAPIAAAQQAAKAQGFVNWVQLLTGLGGQQLAMLAAKLEDAAPELGRWLGVPENLIRGPDERKKILEMVMQMLVQQQQAEAAAAAPAQPPPDPAQQIVNGGAM
jgi:hypothetical protein